VSGFGANQVSGFGAMGLLALPQRRTFLNDYFCKKKTYKMHQNKLKTYFILSFPNKNIEISEMGMF